MIVCNNCGASYADDAPRCPYCGGDNFGRSVQMHEDAVNELKREKRQWEEKPQRMAKTGMPLPPPALAGGYGPLRLRQARHALRL